MVGLGGKGTKDEPYFWECTDCGSKYKTFKTTNSKGADGVWDLSPACTAMPVWLLIILIFVGVILLVGSVILTIYIIKKRRKAAQVGQVVPYGKEGEPIATERDAIIPTSKNSPTPIIKK